MATRDKTRTSMIERVDGIFRAFCSLESSLTLQQIASHVGLPPSSAHRILEQMIAVGWLQSVGDSYHIGLPLLELGGLAVRANRIHVAAAPVLQDLHRTTGHVVHLAIPDGCDAVYLDKVGGRFSSKVPTRIGGRQPLRTTALGKAMLAFASDEHVDRVASTAMTPRTPSTIIDPDVFRRQLGQIRNELVAFDTQESVSGLACIAAPIRGSGRAVAAISICGPASAVDLVGHAPLVRDAAAMIWREAFGG